MLACGILEPLNQFIAALTLLNVNLISFQLGVCFEFGRCKVNQFSFVLYPWFLIKIRQTNFLVTNVGVRSAYTHRYLYVLQEFFATFVSTFLRGLVETMMSSDECPRLCPPLLVSAELSTPIHALWKFQSVEDGQFLHWEERHCQLRSFEFNLPNFLSPLLSQPFNLTLDWRYGSFPSLWCLESFLL